MSSFAQIFWALVSFFLQNTEKIIWTVMIYIIIYYICTYIIYYVYIIKVSSSVFITHLFRRPMASANPIAKLRSQLLTDSGHHFVNISLENPILMLYNLISKARLLFGRSLSFSVPPFFCCPLPPSLARLLFSPPPIQSLFKRPQPLLSTRGHI